MIGYLDAAKVTCSTGQPFDAQAFQIKYKSVLVHIKKTAASDPAANLEETLEPKLKRLFPCN